MRTLPPHPTSRPPQSPQSAAVMRLAIKTPRSLLNVGRGVVRPWVGRLSACYAQAGASLGRSPLNPGSRPPTARPSGFRCALGKPAVPLKWSRRSVPNTHRETACASLRQTSFGVKRIVGVGVLATMCIPGWNDPLVILCHSYPISVMCYVYKLTYFIRYRSLLDN